MLWRVVVNRRWIVVNRGRFVVNWRRVVTRIEYIGFVLQVEVVLAVFNCRSRFRLGELSRVLVIIGRRVLVVCGLLDRILVVIRLLNRILVVCRLLNRILVVIRLLNILLVVSRGLDRVLERWLVLCNSWRSVVTRWL